MEFERYEDVIDAYERDNMGYATLTDYIKGENIKIKEIEMSPLEDLKQSLKKGGPVGIEVLIMEKMKDGGRVPFRFGGAMGSRYGGGTKTSTTAKAPPSMGFGNPPPGSGGGGGGSPPAQTKTKKPVFKSDIDPRFQGLVSPAAGVKFDFLKKQKFYNQPFKLEDITPLELAGAEALGGSAGLESLIKGSNNLTVGKVLENMAGGGYQNLTSSAQDKLQEQILGKVDFGDAFPKNFSFGNITPTIEGGRIDIDETKLDDDAMAAKKFLDLKDGGRVGFNVGGITNPQALAIYNSMSSYGFSDKEIADAITAQGYDAGTLGQTNQSQQPQKKIGAPQQNQGIIGVDLQNARDGDSPMITPFKKDPRVGSAFEAYQRSQALKAMGIDDPFADEVTLEGAYYGDMPDVNLQPGSQTFMGKIKSQLGSMVNLSPTLNLFRGLGQGLADLLPVNKRAIAENIAGNMGIRVDDIGRIVNTGNYNDPSNVMAGYNLNKMTDKTFDKRIDNVSDTLSEKYNLGVNEIKGILEGTLSDEQLADINSRAIMKGTNQTTNLIKQLRSLQIAKERNKFIQDAAKAEADRQKKEREAAKLEKQRAKTREADRAAGAFSNVVQLDPGGGGTFKQQTAAKERQGVQVAGPGFGKGAYFARGGLATMFRAKR
jgi:hypothetical protein|tara:strand:- start:657 stop:2624 length:1968 start_codon:yes stop_codon:yes gene_type:complete